jgi:hypothetical protein
MTSLLLLAKVKVLLTVWKKVSSRKYVAAVLWLFSYDVIAAPGEGKSLEEGTAPSRKHLTAVLWL